MWQVKKVREPHPDIGCWWTLYDYGLDTIKTWDKDYVHPYPGKSQQRIIGNEVSCSMGSTAPYDASMHLGCCASLAKALRSLGAAEDIKRAKDEVERKKRKEEKRKRQAVIVAGGAGGAASPAPAVAQVAAMPVAFLFPGQGSQAVGMLKVRACGAPPPPVTLLLQLRHWSRNLLQHAGHFSACLDMRPGYKELWPRARGMRAQVKKQCTQGLL